MTTFKKFVRRKMKTPKKIKRIVLGKDKKLS